MRMFKSQKQEHGASPTPPGPDTKLNPGDNDQATAGEPERPNYRPFVPTKDRKFHPDVPRPSDQGVSGRDTSPADPADRGERGNTLIVGPNIRLKGEIAACDTLVVQGNIEASMDSRHIDIAEGGVFVGEAAVDTADIAGHFEGTITVRDCLSVRNTGQVRGSIRYGRLSVQDGGVLKGEVELIEDGKSGKTADLKKPTALSGSADASKPAGSGDSAEPQKQVASVRS
ncbi:MAG: polymer-forming cytoskeletal protein [Acetobacterales bacterium]